jgi:type II secretory pathway pseudopilin PulG
VVVLGLVAGITGRLWSSVMQQEREAELLFRGDQYRRAIESYCNLKKGGKGGAYPAKVEDLLEDKRMPEVKRHLRKEYKDPFTGEPFELIPAGGQVGGLGSGKAAIGGFKGVRSTSTLKPFKDDGFPVEYESFKGAASYADWKFVHELSDNEQKKAATGAVPPGTPGTMKP